MTRNPNIYVVSVEWQKNPNYRVTSCFWMTRSELAKLRKQPNCIIKAAKAPIDTAETALKQMGITEK